MIEVVRADITTLAVDAVVNAANTGRRGGGAGEAAVLRRAYDAVFARAREAGDVAANAFPSISTGASGYPRREAAAIALAPMRAHEAAHAHIVPCLVDAEGEALYRALLAGGDG